MRIKIKDEFRKYVPEQEKRCAVIIHSASTAAGAAAAASVIPGSDYVAIAPLQVGMIVALADEFGVPYTESAVRSTLYAALGGIMGRSASSLLLRWIPVYGNVVRAGVAASVTEALGWSVVKKFKAGGKLP